MQFLRLLGVIFIVAGLGFLAGDIFLTEEGNFELHALGWWWSELHRDSLLLLQPAVERYITPKIWDPGIQTLLGWPLVPQFLILGILLLLIGYRQRGGDLDYLR